MSTPSEIVTAFCAEWDTGDRFREAIRSYFTPDTVWENVGMVTTTGIDEAIGLIDEFDRKAGFAAISVDMISIAATGNSVLTERADHMLDKDGKKLLTMRVMGIFVIEGGRVTEWRDYFDTAALAPFS